MINPASIEEIQEEYNKAYDKGMLNHGIRAWFYLVRGLQMLNEFKYLVAGILAFYYTLDLHSIFLLVGIFVVSVPVLIVIGFLQVHKMAKALEWTGMMFSSYFARHNVDLQERQVLYTAKQKELLEEILVELKKLSDKEEKKQGVSMVARVAMVEGILNEDVVLK